MICKKCGKFVEDGARFCEECGAKTDVEDILVDKTKAALDEAAEKADKLRKETRSEADRLIDEALDSANRAKKAADDALNEGVNAVDETVPPNGIPMPAPSAPVMNGPDNFGNPAPPPFYDEPEEEAPQPDESTKDYGEKKTKVGAGRIIGAGIITVIALLLLILLSIMFCMKLGISGNIVKNRVEKMSITSVLDGQLDGKPVYDDIYGSLAFSDLTNGSASRSDFREYLAKTDLLGFAAEKAAAYTDYMMNGNIADPSVSNNDITAFFEGNSGVDKEVFGYELKIADYNKLRSQLEKNKVEENLSLDKWSRTVGFSLDNLSYLFSFITLRIILALILVLLIWIAVIVDKRGKHLMGAYGNIFMWSGIIVFTIGAVIIAGGAIAYMLTGEAVFYIGSNVLLPFALFAVATGALEFILGSLFKRIRRAIRRKEKRNKAVEKALAANS